MKHLFVPYDIAKQLKEKGFKESCLAGFLIADEGQFCIYGLETNHEDLLVNENDWLNAPLYAQVVDWFRENHQIHIQIYRQVIDNSYCIKIVSEKTMDQTYNFHITHPTYYEALTKAIKEALIMI